jgi:hypothetical protein
MATNDKTKEASFGFSPVQDRDTLAVKAGCDSLLALSQAGALEEGVKELLSDSVGVGGLGPNTAYLCAFAMDAAFALRTAANAVA